MYVCIGICMYVNVYRVHHDMYLYLELYIYG